MSEDTTRRGFLTVAGAGAATALAGCSSGPTEESTESDGSTDGDGDSTDSSGSDGGPESVSNTLQMMSPGPIQTLDPISAKGSGVGFNQYGKSLMGFPDGQYPPEAELVEDYSMSDDGLTYTFDLKQGITFHDGTELTAEDVVYSYRRLAGSENSRNRDDIIGETMTIAHEKDASISEPTDEETLADYVPGSLAVEAVDEYTFEMTLAAPFQYTLFQIAGGTFAILPANSVGDVEGYEGEYDYNEFFSTAGDGPAYAGLGAFEVDTWSKGSELQLTAFDDYYGEGPELDGITYTVVGSGNTRLSRFENGNADILDEGMPTASFNPDNVSIEETQGNRSIGTYTLGNGTEVNYGEIPALTTEYLVFNCLEVPLPVRRAFAYAMNQHDIAESIYKGNAKPAYHMTPPDRVWRRRLPLRLRRDAAGRGPVGDGRRRLRRGQPLRDHRDDHLGQQRLPVRVRHAPREAPFARVHRHENRGGGVRGDHQPRHQRRHGSVRAGRRDGVPRPAELPAVPPRPEPEHPVHALGRGGELRDRRVPPDRPRRLGQQVRGRGIHPGVP